MARFSIVRVSINRYNRIYDELIESLAASLADLGHVCEVKANHFDPNSIHILVGSTIFSARHHNLVEKLHGQFYVVYQLEQLDEMRGLWREWPEYHELLRNAALIWDYSQASTKFLIEHGFPRVRYLPPCFHPVLDKFRPATEPRYDLVFTGSPHPRRKRVLDALHQSGLKIAHVIDIFGVERDRLIADAKIAINIHAWDDLLGLETARLSYLLANRCFAISETSDHNPYEDGVVYADYDKLVATCLDYLKRPAAERDAIAEKGFAAVRKTKMVDELRTLVAELKPG